MPSLQAARSIQAGGEQWMMMRVLCVCVEWRYEGCVYNVCVCAPGGCTKGLISLQQAR